MVNGLHYFLKKFNCIKENLCLNFEQGLWFGLLCGLVVQTILLICITLCTNWNKEVRACYGVDTFDLVVFFLASEFLSLSSGIEGEG
jgi:hypothetical protein